MWLGPAVDVEACGGGVALVRMALRAGEEGGEDEGDPSCGGGERARLKDAAMVRVVQAVIEWWQQV